MGALRVIWSAVFIPACFHPHYDHPACGSNGECPSGLICNAQLICEGSGDVISDAAIDTPPDAQACFGTGIVKVCLAAAPTQPLSIDQAFTFDTSSGSSVCAPIVSDGDYCVVAATTITVNMPLRATGPRPLVLLASTSISSMAAGRIDVGSRRGANPEIGAGADPTTGCNHGTSPGTSGGGAGGSFVGVGGAGGNATGGTAGAAIQNITTLRGGCPGQDGDGSAKGAKGHGGGAVYLIAGNMIDLKGGINAAGEGGTGGATNTSGGGGGGSGGMIGLDAPTINVMGLLLANGGAGGEGSGNTTAGQNGADPTDTMAAKGGAGGSMNGGDGGDGSAGTAAGAGAPGLTDISGGGGGGGAGLIKAPAGAMLGNMVSPTATL